LTTSAHEGDAGSRDRNGTDGYQTPLAARRRGVLCASVRYRAASMPTIIPPRVANAIDFHGLWRTNSSVDCDASRYLTATASHAPAKEPSTTCDVTIVPCPARGVLFPISSLFGNANSFAAGRASTTGDAPYAEPS